MNTPCQHVDQAREVTPSAQGCESCLRTGDAWVKLRICMTCGHVGCCDSSPNRHATAHAQDHPDHPLIRSFEPGEDWWWCYPDEIVSGSPAPRPPPPTSRSGHDRPRRRLAAASRSTWTCWSTGWTS